MLGEKLSPLANEIGGEGVQRKKKDRAGMQWQDSFLGLKYLKVKQVTLRPQVAE